MKLTIREQKFIKEYAKDGNGTRSARAAGYSESGARQQANRLLSRAHIQDALQKHAAKTEVTVAQALENIGRIANASPERIKGADVLKANELILKVNGALNDQKPDRGITVNIGFLQAPGTAPPHAAIDATVMPTVMPLVSQSRAGSDSDEA